MDHTDEVCRNPFSQDWRIWAEIQYLDSPTNYREYLLPLTPTQPDHAERLVLLTEARRNSKDGHRAYLRLVLMGFLFIGAGYLLWSVILDKL